ncbi:MAG: hypothetical protein US18_C0007G0011 [Parcubacteria group bacterium GW2011_GWB1_36_5]|nr:MAG: hypothetical protein US18_C0007G0011 [Parcubacteria group bacterium GW2011_GWB1_36_5]
MVGKMLLDGVRDPEKVADVLQTIVDLKVYLKQLFVGEVITFGDKRVVIYELIKNATFQKMFGDLDEKCQDWKDDEEILTFAGQNREKLGPNANFFKRADGFVVLVYLDRVGQPYVHYVSPLSHGLTWSAEYRYRVFSPQQ